MFGPELIRLLMINEQLFKTARSAVSKDSAASAIFLSAPAAIF